MHGATVEHSEAELRAFVGPRSDYYSERWRRLEEAGHRRLPFNFAAFFLGFVWVLYRRMYGIFWLAVAVFLAEAAISEWVAHRLMGLETTTRTYDLLSALVYAATFGTFANLWYFRHAQRRLRALKARGADERQIIAAGGVRWVPPVSLVVLGLAALLAARA